MCLCVCYIEEKSFAGRIQAIDLFLEGDLKAIQVTVNSRLAEGTVASTVAALLDACCLIRILTLMTYTTLHTATQMISEARTESSTAASTFDTLKAMEVCMYLTN